MTTMARSRKDRDRALNGADRYAVLGRKRLVREVVIPITRNRLTNP